ncbi:MAG TPA: HAD family hydrolase [Candidatus Paceibacterota bacterium]|nr:HAD family hydrolase [Candidatus Paceibacterota bacterium]
MKKAIFLDRDGVINKLVFNHKTNEYESPHDPSDLEIISDTLEPMKRLEDSGYYLFVVSNQPSFTKGKTTLEKIKEIHQRLQKKIEDYGINIREYYYCYHHPKGVVSEYSFECDCRKPKTFFLNKAKEDYDLDLRNSWMIGDQDSDIECGNNAGVGTIMILNEQSRKKRGHSYPNYSVNNLLESANLILNNKNENRK